jgi:hypothetical protein
MKIQKEIVKFEIGIEILVDLTKRLNPRDYDLDSQVLEGVLVVKQSEQV